MFLFCSIEHAAWLNLKDLVARLFVRVIRRKLSLGQTRLQSECNDRGTLSQSRAMNSSCM